MLAKGGEGHTHRFAAGSACAHSPSGPFRDFLHVRVERCPRDPHERANFLHRMLPCPVQFHRVRPLLRVEAFAAPVRTIPSTLSHAPRRRSPLRPVCAIPISVLRKLPIVVAHSVRGHKAASLAVVLWIYASSLSTRSGVPRRTSPPRSGRTPIPGAEAAPDRAVGMGHMAHSHCPDRTTVQPG